MVAAAPTGHSRAGTSRGGPTFWLLLLLGFATLAPCLLLPEWREYQAIAVAEQVEQHRTATMAALVQEKHRLLERLHQDPAVVVRLAQRELRYRRADCDLIPVAGASTGTVLLTAPTDVLAGVEPADPIVIEPPQLPVWLARWSDLLPPYNYDGVFCDGEVRPILVIMSVALIALAFALYGRRVPGTASYPVT